MYVMGISLIVNGCSEQRDVAAGPNSNLPLPQATAPPQVKPEQSEPAPKAYDIGIAAKMRPQRTLSLDISSDLPPGSSLAVWVSRHYHQKGKAEQYSGDLFNQPLPLRDGKIHVDVPINDANWYNEHEAKVQELPRYVFPPSSVSPNIDVEVLFVPSNQPPDVQRMVGEHGELLRGRLLKGNDARHWLTVSKSIAVPFERGLAVTETLITAQMFGKDWPFTVAEGTLSCVADRKAVTFRVAEKTYALNGRAMANRKYLPVEQIWARDEQIPGSRKDLGRVIEKGLALCH